MSAASRYIVRGLSFVALLAGGLLLIGSAQAHEARPAYLEITETAPNQFSFLWRTPVLSGNRLLVSLQLPEGVRDVRPQVDQELADSRVERRWIDAGPEGLGGKRVEFVGLQFTITAFTVAHSITLALATLGVVQPARPPIEVAIALSILFLAPEILRDLRGGTSFTLRHPWVVAFVFGLLHGFGFSSVLIDAGLPRSDLPLALLSFNIGVEIGQLAFVGLLLLIWMLGKKLYTDWPGWTFQLPAYVVGILGAFWTVRGMAQLVGGL